MKRLLVGLTVLALAAPTVLAQELPETLLRHDNFLVFEAEAGQAIAIEVESIAKSGFRYGDDMAVEVISPESERVLRELVPLGESASISFEPSMNGTHAVRVASGWNLVRAGISGAPWALVGWKNVPINISGKMAPLYFKVLDGVEEFTVALSASVTGEGAEVTVFDANGEVAVSQVEDYDALTSLKIDVPDGTDGALWELRITDPEVEGLNLDDVQFYLAGRIPPFLSPDPDHVEVFASGERYKPDIISDTVTVEDSVSINAGESASFTWQMPQFPEDAVYALRISGTDVDYPKELMVRINDHAPLAVPITGNAATETFTLLLPREMLRDGENTMTLTQDPGGGSNVVAAKNIQILIGERIQEYKGY